MKNLVLTLGVILFFGFSINAKNIQEQKFDDTYYSMLAEYEENHGELNLSEAQAAYFLDFIKKLGKKGLEVAKQVIPKIIENKEAIIKAGKIMVDAAKSGGLDLNEAKKLAEIIMKEVAVD